MWNKDEVRGKAERIKGRVKESVANANHDERLKDEAVAEQASGAAREGFGRGRRKVGNAIKDLGKKIGR
jgi:uncharacterized protein YjbJ (UPF0337 family)